MPTYSSNVVFPIHYDIPKSFIVLINKINMFVLENTWNGAKMSLLHVYRNGC